MTISSKQDFYTSELHGNAWVKKAHFKRYLGEKKVKLFIWVELIECDCSNKVTNSLKEYVYGTL